MKWVNRLLFDVFQDISCCRSSSVGNGFKVNRLNGLRWSHYVFGSVTHIKCYSMAICVTVSHKYRTAFYVGMKETPW